MKKIIRILFYFLVIATTSQATQNKPLPKPGEYQASVNGVTLWFKISGHGPVMLFPSPGWGVSSDLYFLSMQPLEKLYTVIYVDTRGSGRSSPSPTGVAYDFGQFADDLNALRIYLGQDRVWLFGHSMGGTIALDYGIRYGNTLNGLILADTPVAFDSEFSDASVAALESKQNEPWYGSAVQALNEENPPMPNDTQFRQILDAANPFYFFSQAKLTDSQPLFDQCIYTAAEYNIVFGNPLPGFSPQQMATISAPTLVMASELDVVVPVLEAHRAADAIPGSQFASVGNAGHFPWLENPLPFYAAIASFLFGASH